MSRLIYRYVLLGFFLIFGGVLYVQNFPQVTNSATQSLALAPPLGEKETKHYIIHAEVADTKEKRAKGLMHRASLPPSGGMLFTWKTPTRTGFWMKNTPLPLTIIYANKEDIVYVVRRAEPFSEEIHRPPTLVTQVLEIEASHPASAYVQTGWTLKPKP